MFPPRTILALTGDIDVSDVSMSQCILCPRPYLHHISRAIFSMSAAMLGFPDLRSLFAEAGSEGWSGVGSTLVISAEAGLGSPAAGEGEAVTAGSVAPPKVRGGSLPSERLAK